MELRDESLADLGAQFLGLAEEILRVAVTCRADGLRPGDGAVLLDEDRGAIADARVVQPKTVGACDVPLGMEIGQQGELDRAEAVGPSLVTELGIDGDTQDLGIAAFELSEKSVQAGDFTTSRGGEVERVENEQDVLLAIEIRELHLRVEMGFELEVGSLGADRDDGHGFDSFSWAPHRWGRRSMNVAVFYAETTTASREFRPAFQLSRRRHSSKLEWSERSYLRGVSVM